MKAKILSIEGTETGTIDLPVQFDEEIRKDLIEKAIRVIQMNKKQPIGTKKEAGKRASGKLSKRRRNYRGSYGHGIARTPRKIFWRRGTQFGWEGAVAPNTRGGRRAHPPKAETIYKLSMNKKEKRKAIRSAIAATASKNLVRIKTLKEYPLIIESKLESISKTKDIIKLFLKWGLEKELERIEKRKVRAGKGKTRGRKYKNKKSVLVVVSKKCPLVKAVNNIQGMDICEVKSLNAEILAPGANPGRAAIYTKDAIEKMEKEKLFM